MPLAIFDLDDTLIAGDSDTAWFLFMISKGLVSAEHAALSDQFDSDYHAGNLDVDAYLKLICTIMSQQELPLLLALRRQFMAQVIEPMMLTKAEALLANHRSRGHEIILITSTLEFIVEPIAESLGIEHLIASVPEIVDGSFTGKTIGTASFQQGKVVRLKEWLQFNEQSLAGSYGYSDSHNDLPLLSVVDNPCAVDPDDTLQATAIRENWSIISLRDN